MTFLLRFLLFITAFFILRKLLNYLFGKKAASARRRVDPATDERKVIAGQTVKDPQCGTYVAASIAVPLQLKGKTYHFCSTRCRDQYLKEARRPSSSVA